MIVADTGAVIALLDRSDRHHHSLRELFERAPDDWVLPWVILPEVDYLAGTALSARVQHAFLADLAEGLYRVEFGTIEDLAAAERIHTTHRALRLGLVDACVMALAERIGARAIATLDERHFGAVTLKGQPRLFPRDL